MIKVQNTINAPIEKVWKLWTLPEHIKNWNNASADWHTPYVENDLKAGGKFKLLLPKFYNFYP
ncbi:SRPBCC domain-containing protein [Flavobacterium sp. LBUM151]